MIPLVKFTFYDEARIRQRLSKFILGRKPLSMGKYCEKFEARFAQEQGRRNAVLFNSGGSANLALVQALLNLDMLKNGDRVGFSAVTWSTNVMPLMQLGLIPVPIDVELETLNVSSATILAMLQRSTPSMIFITNALGLAGDLDEIRRLCKSKNILLLEDNCESLGTELHSGKSGNFGLASTFSFYVAHHMSTIEGGMVCTDDESLAVMLRIVRANGWDRNLADHHKMKYRRQFRIKNEFKAKYTFYDLGYNLRPTEITGFLGYHQIEHLERIVHAREKNFEYFMEVIENNPDFHSLEYSHLTKVSSFAIPVIAKSKTKRDQYVERFNSEGIEVRPIIAGNIATQPFFKKYNGAQYHLPNSDYIDEAGFYFGNYPELSSKDMKKIRRCLTK